MPIFIHRDPFDKLLIATAVSEEMYFVTADANIQKYPVNCIWPYMFSRKFGFLFRITGLFALINIYILAIMNPMPFVAKYMDPLGRPCYNAGMKALRESTLRILAAIRAVPEGRVSCYRDIGFAAGLPNGARQVARILHSMGETEKLPWHRIVKADCRIALREGSGKELQIELLRNEGVRVSKAGAVDPAFMLRYAGP
jgi:methylated-DNA-protein-cysteine methyltransferase-like protein